MSTEFQDLQEQIGKQPWFLASEAGVQRAVLNLGEEATGLLCHLAARPIEGGGVRLIRLENFYYPGGKIFGVLINFRVENIETGAQYCYQYFTWKQGEMSGSKGVVLIRGEAGAIIGVLCLKGFCFAVGRETYDSVGGFAKMNNTSILETIAKNGMLREMTEEMGIEGASIVALHKLGRVFPDRGMTPNCPALFAAEIDGSSSAVDLNHRNSDWREMTAKVIYIPYVELWGRDGFIFSNEDGYFKSIISQLVAIGILIPPFRERPADTMSGQ